MGLEDRTFTPEELAVGNVVSGELIEYAAIGGNVGLLVTMKVIPRHHSISKDSGASWNEVGVQAYGLSLVHGRTKEEGKAYRCDGVINSIVMTDGASREKYLTKLHSKGL